MTPKLTPVWIRQSWDGHSNDMLRYRVNVGLKGTGRLVETGTYSCHMRRSDRIEMYTSLTNRLKLCGYYIVNE